MLLIWYIWSRLFWFVTTETAPWPFVRYRVYRIFFSNIFTYVQLNIFQKKILDWFYIYLFFLPMSANFANNYRFTMNRHYFSPMGYKFITYEGLSTVNTDYLSSLSEFSEELFIFKKSDLLSPLNFFELSVFLRYLSNKYYVAYLIYYLKSFREFEPLNFKDSSHQSVYLITTLAYIIDSGITRYEIYDLDKSSQFSRFLRDVSSSNFFSSVPRLPTFRTKEDFTAKYYERLIAMKLRYQNAYKPFGINDFFFHHPILTKLLGLKFQGYAYIKINLTWLRSLRKHLYVRFSDSSVSKYIAFDSIKNQKIYYIRKNRIFNKGRYSRNRQLYRTGVFWCLWLNVIVVYGLYFFFYRFTFNFGYLWLGLAFLAFSFIFARVLQARLYDIRVLINEFIYFWAWVCTLFTNTFNWLYQIYLGFFSKYLFMVYSNLVFNKFLPVVYTSYLYKFFLFFLEETRKMKSARFVYFWEYFVGEDKSFLKIRTKIHWFKQVWKMLTT